MTGKVAIVTGSASLIGMGFHVAESLVSKGYLFHLSLSLMNRWRGVAQVCLKQGSCYLPVTNSTPVSDAKSHSQTLMMEAKQYQKLNESMVKEGPSLSKQTSQSRKI